MFIVFVLCKLVNDILFASIVTESVAILSIVYHDNLSGWVAGKVGAVGLLFWFCLPEG